MGWSCLWFVGCDEFIFCLVEKGRDQPIICLVQGFQKWDELLTYRVHIHQIFFFSLFFFFFFLLPYLFFPSSFPFLFPTHARIVFLGVPGSQRGVGGAELALTRTAAAGPLLARALTRTPAAKGHPRRQRAGSRLRACPRDGSRLDLPRALAG